MEQKEQHIVWHDDVVMKQFISYAVGCMVGRYHPIYWLFASKKGALPVHRLHAPHECLYR